VKIIRKLKLKICETYITFIVLVIYNLPGIASKHFWWKWSAAARHPISCLDLPQDKNL